MEQRWLELNQKVDALADEVAFLTEEARLQQRRRQEADELKHDLFGPLSQEAFLTLMMRLDGMERNGYFEFMRGGLEIVDRVVTSFDEEDVRQLGENIVLILETLRQMTQPEIMHLLQNTAIVMREEEATPDVSLLALLRQLNEPAVRRGLSKTLTLLRTVSEN